MRGTSVAILAGATAAVLAAAWWATSSSPATKQAQSAGTNAPLFPELRARAGQIATINLVTKDGETVLERTPDGSWTIASKAQFPARLEAIRQVVSALADARIIEPKTRDPQRYRDLGVEDPASPDATSIGLRLVTREGERIAAVIVGRYDTASPAGRPRVFVRRLGEDQALLVEGEIMPERQPIDWADRTVVNIENQRVRSVTIERLGEGDAPVAGALAGEVGAGTVVVERVSPGGPASLLGIPEGRRLREATLVDELLGGVSFLRIDDVRAAGAGGPDVGTRLRATWRTFEGLTVTAEVLLDGWIRLSSAYEEAGDGTGGPAAVGGAASLDEPPAADDASKQVSPGDAAKALEEAQRLGRVLARFEFRLPEFRVARFDRTMADMTEEIPEASRLAPEGALPAALPLDQATDQATDQPPDPPSAPEPTPEAGSPAGPAEVPAPSMPPMPPMSDPPSPPLP